jgi:hypothetical protein
MLKSQAVVAELRQAASTAVQAVSKNWDWDGMSGLFMVKV